MSTDSTDIMEMSLVEKRSVLKLAVDLVKADDRIHHNEIAILERLRSELGLDQDEIDLIHYITTQEAVSALSGLSSSSKKHVTSILRSVISSDSDIDFEEALILSAIQMCLEDRTSSWASIISSRETTPFSSRTRQIVYLEKSECKAPRRVLDDKYDNLLITKTLSDIGLELYYLPNVLDSLTQKGNGEKSQLELLGQSLEYLIPAGEKNRISDLENELKGLDISTFCTIVLSRHGIRSGDIPYDAFLLVKIRQGDVLDDNNDPHQYSDFLAIDLTDDIKARILDFVSRLDGNQGVLSYDGYHRILFDFLSSESKTVSRIAFDSRWNIILRDMDNKKVAFQSSPQSRTLLLACLRYGEKGISQDAFMSAISYLGSLGMNQFVSDDGRFDTPRFLDRLLCEGTDGCMLIYNIARIYSELSTKDSQSVKFPSYILSILVHRSSLKNYISKGFQQVGRLSNPDIYCIEFDKTSGAYLTRLSASSVSFVDAMGVVVPLTSTSFWKSLR